MLKISTVMPIKNGIPAKGDINMATDKFCALCNNTFEAEEGQTHCSKCKGFLGANHFFGADPDSLV